MSDNGKESDQELLNAAHAELQEFRATLLDRLEKIENYDIRKRVLADSMISGIFNHLRQVADEQDMWAERIGSDWRGLAYYVRHTVAEFKNIDFGAEGIGGRARGVRRQKH